MANAKNTEYTPIPKNHIEPFRITVTLEATKLNQKGTFCAFKVIEVSDNVEVSQHYSGGGSLYLKLANDIETPAQMKKAGITIIEKAKKQPAKARKLF